MCLSSSHVAGVGHEHGHRTREHSRLERISPAREDDRHAATEHDAAGGGPGKVLELLGENVATLEIGGDQDVGPARHGRNNSLGARSSQRHSVVEGQWAVEDASLDLPSVSHFAQGCRVECGAEF